MNSRARVQHVSAALLGVVLLGSCGFTEDSSTPDTVPPLPTNKPIVTTIRQIASGKFRSSVDKQGRGGTLVTVRNLKVLAITPNEDGDWHVVVTDGRMPAFITEIIPRDQKAGVKKPAIGAYIVATGVAFFDVEANVPAHEYTPWEIHPVTEWHLDPAHKKRSG